MRIPSCAAIFVLIICCLGSAFAQLDRGSIEGQARDALDLQPVVAAEVRLLDSAGSLLRQTETDASGEYFLPGLRSREYRLELRKPLYATAVIESIRVLAGYSGTAPGSISLIKVVL